MCGILLQLCKQFFLCSYSPPLASVFASDWFAQKLLDIGNDKVLCLLVAPHLTGIGYPTSLAVEQTNWQREPAAKCVERCVYVIKLNYTRVNTEVQRLPTRILFCDCIASTGYVWIGLSDTVLLHSRKYFINAVEKQKVFQLACQAKISTN